MRQSPGAEQAVIARFVLHDLEEDTEWRRASEAHAGVLSTLVSDIIAEDDRGECPDLDPDRM
ncbi:MAG: hypothetical protein WD060_08265 [Pirellulales bacterium]